MPISIENISGMCYTKYKKMKGARALKLDRGSETPIYIQIYNFIAGEITNGYRAPGEALPTRRALCRELGVSPATVENAYGKLISDGYIISRPGSAYYVTMDRAAPPEAKPASGNIYNFSSNGVEISKLPFAKWSKLMISTIRENTDLFQHGEKYGEYCLRNSIRRLLYRTQGIRFSPEQVIIGPGTDDLMRDLFLLTGGRYPLLMNNYYNYRVKNVADELGLGIEYIENCDCGIEISELERYKTGLLYQKPTHDLPTGSTLSSERRGELIKWLGGNRYILEDLSENDFCYVKRKKTLWELSGGENVILIGGFSTTIAPSMKIGYIILPEPLIKLWTDGKRFYSNRVSRIEQVTLSRFIDLGYYEQHVGYMRSIYREKMNTVKGAVAETPLARCTRLSGCDEGLFCLAQFDISLSENESYQLLMKNGVKASTLSSCIKNAALSRYPLNTYIIGFGELKISQIQDGIRKWARAWRPYITT